MNFSHAVNVFAMRVTYSACFIQHYFMVRTVTTFRFTLLGVLYLLLKSHRFCAYSFGVRTSDDSLQAARAKKRLSISGVVRRFSFHLCVQISCGAKPPSRVKCAEV